MYVAADYGGVLTVQDSKYCSRHVDGRGTHPTPILFHGIHLMGFHPLPRKELDNSARQHIQGDIG